MTRNNFGNAVAALAGHDRPTQCRAEQLLAQQQVQGDWEFISARRYESSCTDAIQEMYEVVADREQGGYWLRKKRDAGRTRLAAQSNRYERPVTRFGDLMDGLSHITKGLQKIDQASDGDVGEALFELFR